MKSHDLILIRKGSFNETIDPKTFHVQYKQIVSPTCGYIVSVKTFDERHWQQREGILKRRSCQKTLLEIHPCNSFSSTYKPTKASICRIEGEKKQLTLKLTATKITSENGMVGEYVLVSFFGGLFLCQFPGVDTRPLVAVSPAFEVMTGSWGGVELVGKKWIGLGWFAVLSLVWWYKWTKHQLDDCSSWRKTHMR